jgi:FAD/FMN-containing dehydrogenase
VRDLPEAKIEDDSIWDEIREFTPRFLAANPDGAVVPIVSKLSEMAAVAENLKTLFVARAGSGVIYAHYAQKAPEVELGGDFAMMTKVKDMFDPERLLNRGRLYGRI